MFVLGIDIGGTSTKVGLVDEKGAILKRLSVYFDKNITQEQNIEKLAHSIKDFFAENYSVIGIGCPGSINSVTGFCDYSNNLDWHNLNVCGIISSILNKPCYIANDANLAILGEAKYGCGKKYHNLVLLTLGTGVGGGLYLNDQLYEGVDGKGAELGHIPLDIFNGRKCTCGEYGCIEAYCSATALINDAKNQLNKYPDSILNKLNNIDGKTIFDGFHQNDELCVKVVNDYISYLGKSIIIYINIFRPEAIVISGGICRQGEWFTNKLEKYIADRHYGFGDENNKPVKILIAELGPDTGILGSAALAFDKLK